MTIPNQCPRETVTLLFRVFATNRVRSFFVERTWYRVFLTSAPWLYGYVDAVKIFTCTNTFIFDYILAVFWAVWLGLFGLEVLRFYRMLAERSKQRHILLVGACFCFVFGQWGYAFTTIICKRIEGDKASFLRVIYVPDRIAWFWTLLLEAHLHSLPWETLHNTQLRAQRCLPRIGFFSRTMSNARQFARKLFAHLLA